MKDNNDLRERTRSFAIRVVKLVRALPKTVDGRAIGGQLVRSGTSVGANYCAACRARSRKEFIAKLGVSQEEADESEYWMDLIIETEMMPRKKVEVLRKEAGELTAILAASIKTAKNNGN